MAIIKWRRALASQWTTENPVLREGEAGFEKDTNSFKIGNGVDNWSDLEYFKDSQNQGGGAASFVDNGDGGFISGTVKLAGWNWVNTTFAKIANAVQLATTPPSAPGTAFAGSATTAARGDHRHPGQAAKPSFLRMAGTWVSDCMKNDSTRFELPLTHLALRPMFISTTDHQPLTINGLGVQVVTGGGAGSTVKVGIWGSNADGTPNWTNLLASATIATDTAGNKTATFANVSLPEGQYWSAGVAQGGAAPVLLGADPFQFGIRLSGTDPTASSMFDQVFCYRYLNVTGNLPTATPSGELLTVNNGYAMNVWMKVVT